jgi:hypothetical protein
VRWIEGTDPPSAVLWVNGRAGVGKSALAQWIAEMDDICFGGCFFFRRGTHVTGATNKDHLFCTLAYQLAMNVPDMLKHTDHAMAQDFSLPEKSATVQLKRLIVEPFNSFRFLLAVP